MTRDAWIDRVETATGSHMPLGKEVICVFSGTLWPHIRLHQGQTGARENPEGYFTRDERFQARAHRALEVAPADPTVPLTEVAFRSGFASQTHFTTASRRLTSVTPRSYRRSIAR